MTVLPPGKLCGHALQGLHNKPCWGGHVALVDKKHRWKLVCLGILARWGDGSLCSPCPACSLHTVIWKSWMVSLRLEQETALPREVRKLHADFLLNRRLHGKYGAAAQGRCRKCLGKKYWIIL
ncbi:uncharacterized protein LOC120607069 isoform X5 [Pteropus medius]|uniref:uncharacterized protein LOC120607069 isoform X5 n=1 Tax=Pteropus vampyrus TaxID=132908 RepID=UPI00196A4F7B|nr:uncharacterized protein LOC120607069 isoform X5 [Pteropus giganteus]